MAESTTPSEEQQQEDDAPPVTFKFAPATPAPTAVPARERERAPPRAPAVPQKLRTSALAREMEQNADEYEAALQELDVEGTGRLSITIMREWPKDDEETGELYEGWMGKFDYHIDRAEIEERFGGGRYKAMIYGPNPDFPTKTKLLTTREIKIPGWPIPKKRPGGASARGRNNNGGSEVGGVVDKLMTAQQQQLDRVVDVLGAQKEGGATGELVGVLSKMLDPARGAQDRAAERAAEKEARDQERADREQERERIRTEAATARQAELDRREQERKEEREERKAEREAAAARHAHELQLLQIQRDKDIAAAQQQAELQLQTMKMQQESQRQQFELQLASVKAQSENKESSALTMAKALQEMQNTQAVTMQKLSQTAMEQQQAFTQMQMASMSKQLEAANASGKGGTKELLETIRMVDEIRGGRDDDDDAEPMALRVVEKLGDTLGKVAPGLFAAAGVGVSARRNRERAEERTEIEPGSVAVVEDAGVRRRRRLRRRDGKPGAAGAKPIDAEVIPSDIGATVVGKPNDLTDYVFPAGGPHAALDMPTVELLVKNIDLAMQKHMEPADIVAIVKRFPIAVVDYLKELEVEQIISTLEGIEGTEGWMINSLGGQEKLKKIHKLLQ